MRRWALRYGFNIAPAYLRGNERSTVAARAAVNTTICGCAAALTVRARPRPDLAPQGKAGHPARAGWTMPCASRCLALVQ